MGINVQVANVIAYLKREQILSMISICQFLNTCRTPPLSSMMEGPWNTFSM
jgi:hypothetical protein